ncbi:MAG: HAMP domain-containing histidine kinase [Kofleriaceae bacterium]|nr:HAMP domain-containing histidine kinase [Kofleriaceae bacterium]
MPVLLYIVESILLDANRIREQLAVETDFDIRVFQSVRDARAACVENVPDAWLVSCRASFPEALQFLRELDHRSIGIAMLPESGESRDTAVRELGPMRVASLPFRPGDLLPKLHCALERQSLARKLHAAESELQKRDHALVASKKYVAQTKEELRAKHDVLETATARLVEAEQLAAVGRVVTGIAHEISNQLALVGYAEAIKSRVPEDSELFEFADAIAIAQRRLATMVGQIRSFTKASSLDHSDETPGDGFELASLSAVVDEALSILRYDKDVRTRSIVCNYSVSPLVLLKREEFDQVVINLVTNAALATVAGDTITVDLREDQEAGCALLTIGDSGQGMSPEVLQRLGEPFFTTRGHRGSGLGVGICMSIAKAHGGSIRYESSVGKGTKATVVLPLFEEG